MKSIQETLPLDNPVLKVRSLIRTGVLETSFTYAHWHKEAEIILNLKGYGIQQINGAFFIMMPGTISVIGQNQLHAYCAYSDDAECEVLVLQFDMDALLQSFDGKDPFCLDWRSGRLFFSEAVTASPELQDLMCGIHAELTSRGAGYRQAVTGRLLQLLTWLYREAPHRLSTAESHAAPEHSIQALAKTFAFLSEHYQQEGLTLQAAAETAHLSVTHFCRLFKLATGVGFHEYLNRYRIAQAERLFCTDKSLLVISFSFGFGSLSSFTRNYKKYRGISPRQARAGQPLPASADKAAS